MEGEHDGGPSSRSSDVHTNTLDIGQLQYQRPPPIATHISESSIPTSSTPTTVMGMQRSPNGSVPSRQHPNASVVSPSHPMQYPYASGNYVDGDPRMGPQEPIMNHLPPSQSPSHEQSSSILSDPILTATCFPARSLIPQRIEENIYTFAPSMMGTFISYGKSIQTPNHAASFATDILRACVETSGQWNAYGWTSYPSPSNQFSILLPKGSMGLCMNLKVHPESISVTSFRRPESQVIGPAEASGLIKEGDQMIGVDGIAIQTSEQFTKVVHRLKSLKPVLLSFRRPGITPIQITTVDPLGYRHGGSTSMYGLDNREQYTAGIWHLGVRYICRNYWATELHVDGGGIRRLGIYPHEREAALVYNRYIHQTYGEAASQFMNPAGNGSISVSQSNVREIKSFGRSVWMKAAFTNEQKEQLRAQIMVFKFTSTGGIIPNDLLVRALKSMAHGHVQDERKKRKPTFNTPSMIKTNRKRNKRVRGKRKKQYSDESEEETSEEEMNIPRITTTQPQRRSVRNAGKIQKSYVMKEHDSDLETSEDEKRIVQEEIEENKQTGPQIDKIIAVCFYKETIEEEEEELQFLVKWKDISYCHLSWLNTNQMEEFGIQASMRMKRWMMKYSRDVEQARENIVIGKERDRGTYFSDSYLEVDRILDVKQVEEPKETNPYHQSSILKQGKKYLVKWRDLSYVDCTWEWEDVLTDDRKIAAYHRYNHPPILQGAHPATFEDIRPDPSTWAKYSESPIYNKQNTLRSYQLEGLNWMVFCWYNRRNCILADEMGLGKTVQATCMLEHLRQHQHIRGPFLVIAPLATLGNWKREIESWTSMNCVVYHDSADIRPFIREKEFYYPNEMYKRRGIYKFNVLITSYQTLMTDAEYLETIHWRYLVIDEAHKLKNRETKLIQCLQQFTWDSCLLMTGTPLQNGVYELWCLLNLIEPDKFPSQQAFYDNYGELNTAEQVASLHEQLRPYMLRRVKEDVEKSIPPKEETIIDVELTTLQKKYYRAIFERNRSFLNMGASGTVANLVNVEMELRKCCNHPFLIRGVEEKECGHLNDTIRGKILIQASGKTVLLDKMLIKFKSERKKVLIFSQFKIMLDIIEDLCSMRNYQIERMDGSVRGNMRQAAIDRFNNKDSETFAFLLSTRAGGVGINLIAASVVILFDSDWNPQNDLQAVARCHRIGQTQSVNIYRLVTKKTYEAQMFEIASKKLGMHHAVFETGGVRNEFDGEENNSNMMSLMSLDRDKVEMMIRYGAYAIMDNDEEQDPENKAINELDIETLLSSSRTIRYDPTGGEMIEENEENKSSALSFSKATFTAETSDTTIDFNDEKFWEKVLGPKTVQVLMTKVQEGELSSASSDEIKSFLLQLRELSREVVKERQRGGTMADADQVMSILIELKVTGPILKNIVNVRTVASEWLEVMERPKRRRNQEAESELMYLEFLDGTKKQGIVHKKKSIRKIKEITSDEEDKKPKRMKKTFNKCGIRITLNSDYTIIRMESTIKKIQMRLENIKEHDGSEEEIHKEEGEEDEEDDDDDEDFDDEDEDSDVKRTRIKSTRSKRTTKNKIISPKKEIISEGDSEMWCRVCFSDQGFMDDPIVQCERCNVAVHKFCYGIENIPDGDTPWYCDYCADTSTSATNASCVLCPVTRPTSAFKKTCEGEWVHVVCALWAPGVVFQDVERMKNVQNIPSAITETRGEHCGVCKEKDGCIKCFRPSCLMYFHPLCGRESKGEFEMYMNETGQLRAFCPKHHTKTRRIG